MEQYIKKSALVAEIEKLYNGEIDTYTRNILDRLKSNIDTLEVKEVESMQENPCDGCTNRKGCVTCENGELRETMQEEPKHKFAVGNKISYLNEEYEIVNITDHYILHTTKRTKIEVLHLAFDNEEFMELVEEPVSDDLEKVVEEIVDPIVLNAYGVKEIANRLRRTMIEPVSDDLEQASHQFVFNTPSLILPLFHDADLKWEKTATEELERAFTAGANWQKECLMKDAVDGEIGYWNIRGLSVNMDLPRTLEEGDKVKLIIIKEG